MWLINAKSLSLESFVDERQVKYAILSHRWVDEEVDFQMFTSDNERILSRLRRLKGYSKIQQCCWTALEDGLKYVWADTCCIDKSSSAELQEAINSMFNYYRQATVCYAYLSDTIIAKPDTFAKSKWFTRGWTLQELIAPREVVFFDEKWANMGTRASRAEKIAHICGIFPYKILLNGWDRGDPPCIAAIMSWASGRFTTRLEDRAYSLLGLFDINMPLLYGEGEKAFLRLQEEIIKRTEDQTVFAWEGVDSSSVSLLASTPDQYPRKYMFETTKNLQRRKPHSVTNQGISLEMPLILLRPRVYLACLNLGAELYGDSDPTESLSKGRNLCIPLKQLDDERYARIPGGMIDSHLGDLVLTPNTFYTDAWRLQTKTIVVVRSLRAYDWELYTKNDKLAFGFAAPNVQEPAVRPRNSSSPRTQYYVNLEPCPLRSWNMGMSVFEKWCITPDSTSLSEDSLSNSTEHATWCGVVSSDVYTFGPIAKMNMKNCSIADSWVGFDDNFAPAVVVSGARLKWQHGMLIPEMFNSRIDKFKRAHPKFLQMFELEILNVCGGTHKEIMPNVFGIFSDQLSIAADANPKIVACILTRPIVDQPSAGSNIMTHITLTLWRVVVRGVWLIAIELNKPLKFAQEPRCHRCCGPGNSPNLCPDVELGHDIKRIQAHSTQTRNENSVEEALRYAKYPFAGVHRSSSLPQKTSSSLYKQEGS